MTGCAQSHKPTNTFVSSFNGNVPAKPHPRSHEFKKSRLGSHFSSNLTHIKKIDSNSLPSAGGPEGAYL